MSAAQHFGHLRARSVAGGTGPQDLRPIRMVAIAVHRQLSDDGIRSPLRQRQVSVGAGVPAGSRLPGCGPGRPGQDRCGRGPGDRHCPMSTVSDRKPDRSDFSLQLPVPSSSLPAAPPGRVGCAAAARAGAPRSLSESSQSQRVCWAPCPASA